MTDAPTTAAAPAATSPAGTAASPAPAAPAAAPRQISEADYSRLPPDQQQRFANVRQPDRAGPGMWVERSDLAPAKPAAAAPATATPAASSPVSTETAPAAQPVDPASYELKHSADFKPPEGVEFKFAPDAPLATAAKNFAAKHGLSQQVFSEMLDVYVADHAGQVASHQAQFNTARSAEIGKLGTTATARIDAVATWAKASLGDELGGQVIGRLWTAADVLLWEAVIRRIPAQSAAAFDQAQRDAGGPGRWSEEQYRMASPAERLNYSRQFDQRQFQR